MNENVGLVAINTSDMEKQVQSIQQLMDSVMVEATLKNPDGHYGVIPGCGTKKVLLKAGAEKLCFAFRLAPSYDVKPVDLLNGHREYSVTCNLTHIPTDNFMGSGVGSCSSMESKYRYRGGGRVCPECGEKAIIRGKKEYGGGWLCFTKKGGCGHKWADGDSVIESQSETKIDNPDIADQFNTILKMACKRALVAAVLNVLAASDIFTQDLEDIAPVADTESAPAPKSQHTSNGSSDNIQAMNAKKKAVMDMVKALPSDQWGDKIQRVSMASTIAELEVVETGLSANSEDLDIPDKFPKEV